MLETDPLNNFGLQGRSKIPSKRQSPANSNQCWVLTDGSIGMENQSLAVAEAVGLPIDIKRVETVRPWRWLPRQLRFGALNRIDPASDPLQPPWPKLLVTTGRHSVPLSIAIRSASLGTTYTVHIQNPKTSLKKFDLVAAPLHDRLSGANVVVTMGAPHRVTEKNLSTDTTPEITAAVSELSPPYLTVLLGGNSKAFSFTDEKALELSDQLKHLAQQSGGSLIITPSRRTPTTVINALSTTLHETPHYIWDGQGENPYFSFLNLADFFIVTGDSVNMITEAAGTGKPVYVFQLDGKSARFSDFHSHMQRYGATRPLSHSLENWSYEPVNDTEKIAVEIRNALGLKKPK